MGIAHPSVCHRPPRGAGSAGMFVTPLVKNLETVLRGCKKGVGLQFSPVLAKKARENT